MKALVTKAFKFAIGGNHVVDVEPGAVVDGRCAEVALAEKWGEPVAETLPAAPALAPSDVGPAEVGEGSTEGAAPVETAPPEAQRSAGKRKGR